MNAELKDGKLFVTNGYWECVHNPERGGCIESIRIFYGSNTNILSEPIFCDVKKYGDWNSQFPYYRDDKDRNGTVDFVIEGKSVIVNTKARLIGRDNTDSNIIIESEYKYFTNKISLSRRFIFGEKTPELNRVSMIAVSATPELDHWTARLSPVSTAINETGVQHNSQNGLNFSNKWGTFQSFIKEHYEWHASSHMAIYKPDSDAIELFPDSDLENWEHGFDKTPGKIYVHSYIKRFAEPRRHVMSLEPYFGMFNGTTVFKGQYDFKCFLSLPNIPKNGFNKRALWLHNILRVRDGYRWATEDEIRDLAEHGVQVLIHHHDSPSGRGIWPEGSFFWPTGTFPPYDETERKNLEHTIELAHKYKIKVIPYFNLTSGSNIDSVCVENYRNWKRSGKDRDDENVSSFEAGISVDKNAVRKGFSESCPYLGNYPVYGACLKSGFMDFEKKHIREVVKYFGGDGAYFDGAMPLFCTNPRHADGKWHYGIEEIMEMIEFTRELVGPEGYVIAHQTSGPLLATQNLLDNCVIMEYMSGFPNFEPVVPDIDAYDPMVNYGNVCSFALCGYSAVKDDNPKREQDMQKMVTRCILNGICFKGLSFNAHLEYKYYKRLSKFMKGFIPEEFRFEKAGVCKITINEMASAAYISADMAFVIIGNNEGSKILEANLNIFPGMFGWANVELEIFNEDNSKLQNGTEISVQPYSYALFKVMKR